MKRREIISLVAGLIVGLLAGMVLIGSSDSLREDLFGSAANSDKQADSRSNQEELVYYQAELPAVQEWLLTRYPDLETEPLTNAVDALASLSDSEDLPGDAEIAQAEIDTVLPRTYQALTGADFEDEVKVEPDQPIEVCLGIDENPTNVSPVLYIYMAVPSEQAKDVELPAEWELTDGPRDNDLFWMPFSCYPDEETLAAAEEDSK
jgi:hypothetical protein